MKVTLDLRWVWLSLGVLIGVVLSTLWPHEPAIASMVDRDDKFTLSTAQVELVNPLEGVFVTDLVSGTIRGAVLHRQAAKFNIFYYRDLNRDFKIPSDRQARYAVVNGQVQVSSRPGAQFGASVLYVAELTTGRLNAYGFPYRDIPAKAKPIELVLIDSFPWRNADPGE